ncbi:hypothetical protein ONS95_012332 [Cadophora gregata]|uniref:uncharacterized protein n=1 Tax=Cadophora gregata TaxID=51156 RepID=UPI0026DBC53E|nr:uncharacterized protein ONS95_012332 [Cadophora gregata]KAK0118021.1 hypothetical protein ONS95_012332 [Cadophora gregata]KAK0123087.1 hypothetical protein ONS96_010095 [Cadophora gregata f. sp. sojae]
MSRSYQKWTVAALHQECDSREPKITRFGLSGTSEKKNLIQKLVRRDTHVRKAHLDSPNFNNVNDPKGENERARIKFDEKFRQLNTDSLVTSEIAYYEVMVKKKI